jgi:hypothetical protein
MRLELPKELTGNSTAADALVAGINGFNLLAAGTAPFFIFPRLGLGGPLAYVALVLVPVVFSLLFFAIPGLRTIGVRRENRRRARRNVRRVLLGYVYRDVLDGDAGVTVDAAARHVASRLEGALVSKDDVDAVLRELAAELDADVGATSSTASPRSGGKSPKAIACAEAWPWIERDPARSCTPRPTRIWRLPGESSPRWTGRSPFPPWTGSDTRPTTRSWPSTRSSRLVARASGIGVEGAAP